jgi:hypothetical protein
MLPACKHDLLRDTPWRLCMCGHSLLKRFALTLSPHAGMVMVCVTPNIEMGVTVGSMAIGFWCAPPAAACVMRLPALLQRAVACAPAHGSVARAAWAVSRQAASHFVGRSACACRKQPRAHLQSARLEAPHALNLRA